MPNDTVQNTQNWAQGFYQWRPNSQGVGNEPLVTSANITQSMILSPPFSWTWNRTEDTSQTTVAGTTDYTISTTTFGWLEYATLTDTNGNVVQIKEVYNQRAMPKSSQQARPNAISVVGLSSSGVTLRLSPAPDKAYTLTAAYQNAPTPIVSPTSTWSIPPMYKDIYGQLLLGFLMDSVNDPRSQMYRRNGIAALLSKAEGLSETQISAFLAIWLARDAQEQASGLRTQLGNQARSV